MLSNNNNCVKLIKVGDIFALKKFLFIFYFVPQKYFLKFALFKNIVIKHKKKQIWLTLGLALLKYEV